jgi:hypothetical protein
MPDELKIQEPGKNPSPQIEHRRLKNNHGFALKNKTALQEINRQKILYHFLTFFNRHLTLKPCFTNIPAR